MRGLRYLAAATAVTGLRLTAAAAKALNAALGTNLFSAGLRLGTAQTQLQL